MELSKKLGPLKVYLQTGIPETSIRRWSKIGPERKGTSGRKPQFEELEEELEKFFKVLRQKGLPVNNIILTTQAKKIADEKNLTTFVGSQGWLEGFKRRKGIVYRKHTRVSQKLKDDSITKLEEFQTEFLRLTAEHKYPLSAIVNIDESGVWFDSPSNYTREVQVK